MKTEKDDGKFICDLGFTAMSGILVQFFWSLPGGYK